MGNGEPIGDREHARRAHEAARRLAALDPITAAVMRERDEARDEAVSYKREAEKYRQQLRAVDTADDIAAALRAYGETIAPRRQRAAWRAAANYVAERFGG